ncbi:hypothetical protein CHELA1G11_12001 [Hyphomicrobiales bacterium]|nr:hypothetical protein CHELA1G11_12001 [Hyphomicrobiales bacterium]CAH1663980.1 hypothetical protein CHELA1G2_12311 [Hyphomicrobiales bacterium]
MEEKNWTDDVSVHDIVQAIPGASEWAPCLVVVSEVKTWGIQGYTSVPRGGEAYIRLTWDKIEPTGGRAVFVPE